MTSSLSNLANNIAAGIRTIKCKNEHDNKNVKRVELKTKIVSAFLNTKTLKIN